MHRTHSLLALLLVSVLSSGCALHSTATHWNGRVGPDGEPVHYKATTKIGLNFLVALPFLGATGIDGMVDELTEEVAEEGGDRIRIVQGSVENYWYGFPPVTWIFTPVLATVAAEYQPSAEQLSADLDAEPDARD